MVHALQGKLVSVLSQQYTQYGMLLKAQRDASLQGSPHAAGIIARSVKTSSIVTRGARVAIAAVYTRSETACMSAPSS
jgi:hypothetical protein